jgi:hypothetical protein
VVDTDYEGLGFRVETESHRKKFSKECRQQMKWSQPKFSDKETARFWITVLRV